MILKAPFPWFGGKSRAAELIWSRLGDVANYVEPFAGSLAVLLARGTAPRIETVNDRDCYLANFWRAVSADPESVAFYADWPVNEADLHARHRWLTEQTAFRERMLEHPACYDSKIAGWWVWGLSQWIGGGWCSRPEWTGRGQGGRSPRGINTVDARRPNAHAMGISCNLDGVAKRPVINRGGRGVGSQNGHYRHNSVDWDVRPDLRAPMGVHAKKPHLSSNGSNGVQAISNPIVDWMFAPASWERVEWKGPRGYSNKPKTGDLQEVIWFSPHCLKQESLFTSRSSTSLEENPCLT